MNVMLYNFMKLLLGVGVLDGVLYAVGGHDGPLVRKSVECYCPASNIWTPIADMHMCRRNAGMISVFYHLEMVKTGDLTSKVIGQLTCPKFD